MVRPTSDSLRAPPEADRGLGVEGDNRLEADVDVDAPMGVDDISSDEDEVDAKPVVTYKLGVLERGGVVVILCSCGLDDKAAIFGKISSRKKEGWRSYCLLSPDLHGLLGNGHSFDMDLHYLQAE